MNETVRIALCQINPTVGDLRGNAGKILDFYRRAAARGADLVVFPEMSLCGYPPEDLVLRKSFVRENGRQLARLARSVAGAACVVGYARGENEKVFNSAAVLQGGRLRAVYSKRMLPNYGVFDEKRTFSPGADPGLFQVAGARVGLTICEDIWEDDPKLSPCALQARRGARILINISASPYHAGKFALRLGLLKRRALQVRRPILYVNMVGGQDELVFDGRTLAVDARGRMLLLARSFAEDMRLLEFRRQGSALRPSRVAPTAPLPLGEEEVYQALVLGTRDYVEKNGFRRAVVGLSGGIDSALTAAIAADALGPERVLGVTLPSRYSSSATRADAGRLAKSLGIRFAAIPIQPIVRAFGRALAPAFRGAAPNIAEENLQSRIRGTLLMALSNKFGHVVLTTGNKSEMSVGYCTLYGDTAGGFAVLKDVPKSLVFRLARHLNRRAGRDRIPRSTIARAPTAELKPNQRDQDTLPPYALLDRVIQGYVEEDLGFAELEGKGFSPGLLAKVLRMIDGSEYKRRQSPPGVKITPKSFGRDRRMPITNKFREF